MKPSPSRPSWKRLAPRSRSSKFFSTEPRMPEPQGSGIFYVRHRCAPDFLTKAPLSQLYHIACQTARLDCKNPQSQPHMAVPRHPPVGPVCFAFWADRGPGASCPYGEGPRRALVTFPRWKDTQGGWAAPAGAFRGQPPQAALGPRWRSAPKLSAGALRPRWSSAPGKLVSTAYTETYRQAQHELDGTFDRAKVPKARWGAAPRNCIILPSAA